MGRPNGRRGMGRKALRAPLGGSGAPAPLPVPSSLAYWPIDTALPTIRDYTGRGNTITRNMIPAASSMSFDIGCNTVGAQGVTGDEAKAGIWHRVTTAGEDAVLATAPSWTALALTSLSDAKAFYMLDEASSAATYADSTGRGNTLTHGGTNGTKVAGPLGTDFAVRLGGGGVTVLEDTTPSADLCPGNQSCTVSVWVKLSALGTTQQLVWGQFNGTDATGGPVIYYHKDNDRWQVDYGNGIDLYRNACVVNDSAGAVSTGVWYHLIAKYDASANTLSLSVNGVTDTLTTVQQPAPVTSGDRPALLFRTNPDYREVPAQSGWDLIGKYMTARRDNNADLSFSTGVSKAAWMWVKFDNVTPLQSVMGIYDSAFNHADWVFQQAAGRMYFVLGNGAGVFNYADVVLNDTNWHLVVGWLNAATGFVHISIDNGAATDSSVATITPTTPVPYEFLMGAATRSGPEIENQKFLGKICLAGVSLGVPSAGDIAALYALGSGLT